jgi:hypothetical protein
MAGLQLLGPEKVANIKIRIFCIFTSALFQTLMIFNFNAPSGLFNLFYQNSEKSHFKEFEENNFKYLYLIWPLSAMAVNGIAKLYSSYLRRKMKPANVPLQIFTLQTVPNDEKFSFSLDAVIGIPLIILLAVFSSTATRRTRLLFFFPLQVSISSTCLHARSF